MTTGAILITGASGFLGCQLVATARSAGLTVRALVRPTSVIPDSWASDDGVEVVRCDVLADGDVLAAAVSGVDAIIHAAAAMTGGDDVHDEATVRPTAALLGAITNSGQQPHFVLISSLSVYDAMSLPPGGRLDENTPTEQRRNLRDAYCRAKLAQEALVLGAADDHQLRATILRPGAIFGPGRVWNGHLGVGVGPALIQLAGDGQVPVTYIDNCAHVIVKAAQMPPEPGQPIILNVIDENPPDRARFLTALRKGGWPKFSIPLSWRLLSALGAIVERIPPLASRAPGLLRRPVLHSRMKPLTYGTDRLRQRLGDLPSIGFEDAMQRSLRAEKKQ